MKNVLNTRIFREKNFYIFNIYYKLEFTDSNHYFSSLLRQQKFLTKLMERLETADSRKDVTAELNSVRKILTEPKSMAFYMAVNVDKLIAQSPDVYTPWKKYFYDIECTTKQK